MIQAPDKKRTVKAEAQRAAVQSLFHYLTHFKLSHAVRKNLLLIDNMKEMAKGGKRNVKPEEFVRVYDILLQVRAYRSEGNGCAGFHTGFFVRGGTMC